MAATDRILRVAVKLGPPRVADQSFRLQTCAKLCPPCLRMEIYRIFLMSVKKHL